ncbi:MAG: hypothetical protein C0402_14760 [Thermodesulfovibrio sp.]|nr:hypothetical protein [Thermodesulfovibrio sp.]
MADDKKTTSDLLGLAPYGETLNTIAKGVVDGAGSFLSRICLPAAEEFGLLLRDKVSAWRATNAIKIAQEAEQILISNYLVDVHAHPRLVMNILSEGSWSDDDTVKSFWAGLLASSCTKDGKDESNIIFLNILAQITSLQARIIEYGCTHATVKLSGHNLLYPEKLETTIQDVMSIVQSEDLHRIDRELDHLRSLEIIGGTMAGGGISMESGMADITPSPLSLQMYARCKGHEGPPELFYTIEKKKT